MRRKRRNGGEGTAARQWQPLTFEQATDVADVVQLRRSLRRRMIALRVFAIVLAIVAVVVGATPSREITSLNSGFSMIIPMALAVSIEEPPPMAMMQSAPLALKAATPVCTFSTVGLALILL